MIRSSEKIVMMYTDLELRILIHVMPMYFFFVVGMNIHLNNIVR